MKAVDGQRHGGAEDFASGLDVAVPHVAGHFGHVGQQAGCLRLAEVLHDGDFLARFQHVQHAAIRVIGAAGVVSR